MSQTKGATEEKKDYLSIELPVKEKESGSSNKSLKTESKTNQSPEDNYLQKKKERTKEKKNRDTCSICRNGGDLLLCDRCPKSFHLECLKLKESLIPEGNWYCPTCVPKIEMQKDRNKKKVAETLDEETKRRIKNEKKKIMAT